MQSVNLMPPGYAQRERAKRRMLVSSAVAVAVSLALFGFSRLVDRRVAGEEQARAAAEEELARLRAAQAELDSCNTELTSLADKLALLFTLDQNRRWASFVARVAEAINENILLTRLQIRPARPKTEQVAAASSGQPPPPLPNLAPAKTDDSATPQKLILLIEGLALATTDVTRFISALTTTGAFERVSFKGSRTDIVNGKPLSRFELECPVRYERERPASATTASEPPTAHAGLDSQQDGADAGGTP